MNKCQTYPTAYQQIILYSPHIANKYYKTKYISIANKYISNKKDNYQFDKNNKNNIYKLDKYYSYFQLQQISSNIIYILNILKIYNKIEMEGVKLTLNVRNIIKKQKNSLHQHIKTQKQIVTNNKQKLTHTSKKINMRHDSVLSYNTSKIKTCANTKEVFHPDYCSKRKSQLPEIHKPISINKKNQSTKYIMEIKQPLENQTKKAHYQNIKKTSQTYAFEQKKAPIRFKMTNLAQTPKEMTKEKRNQLFKAIRSQFHEIINRTNLVSIHNKQCLFNAYIQKGNHGILVKEIIKRRWWWHIVDDPSKANLVWTQWYNKGIMAELANATVQDQTIAVEQYRGKKNESYDIKSSAVRKLVDENTFSKLRSNISKTSKNYFKTSSTKKLPNSLRNIDFDDEIKLINIEQMQKIHNHVQGCLNLHSKKLLFRNFQNFMNLKNMNPFEFLPLTFYVDQVGSHSYQSLLDKYDQLQKNDDQKNIWILKPGQNSNRGNGIKVIGSRYDLVSQIKKRLKGHNHHRTLIVQKYIQNCFLIKNRKFDIRCYLLITTVNGILKGYWYQDGYIRTASGQYDLQNVEDPMIHLTNDAVQKKGEQFGKHEDNNKLSFEGFKKYLKKNGICEQKFDEAYEQMKVISYYLIASVSSKIKRKQFTFELFGLDFMLDDKLKPYLIQANSNPSLESQGKILGKIIYELIDNVIMTAIDPIFPPPAGIKKNMQFIGKDYFQTNKFSLIFAGTQVIKNKQILQ